MFYPECIGSCLITFPHRVVGCHGIIREGIRECLHPVAAGSIPAVKCIAVPCNTAKIRYLWPCPGPKVIRGQTCKVGGTGQGTACLPACHKQIALHGPAGCHTAIAGKLYSRPILRIELNLNQIPKINRIRRVSRDSHGKYHDCRQHPCQL